MINIVCPRCKSSIEIDEYKKEDEHRIAIFCTKKDCLYHKNPIIGIDRKTSEVYIAEALI